MLNAINEALLNGKTISVYVNGSQVPIVSSKCNDFSCEQSYIKFKDKSGTVLVPEHSIIRVFIN